MKSSYWRVGSWPVSTPLPVGSSVTLPALASANMSIFDLSLLLSHFYRSSLLLVDDVSWLGHVHIAALYVILIWCSELAGFLSSANAGCQVGSNRIGLPNTENLLMILSPSDLRVYCHAHSPHRAPPWRYAHLNSNLNSKSGVQHVRVSNQRECEQRTGIRCLGVRKDVQGAMRCSLVDFTDRHEAIAYATWHVLGQYVLLILSWEVFPKQSCATQWLKCWWCFM